MKKKEYKKLDCSIESYQYLKEQSEKYWEEIELEILWGFQIQSGSKWKKGLLESELKDFQQQLQIEFPESLKNFYRTMNGLTLPGINNNGNEGPITYGPKFYSYPEDIIIIKEQINWVLEENNLTRAVLKSKNIPQIFPYYGHRFLILDDEEFVLSMYGNDIIFWDDNLAKGIAKDIFEFHNQDLKTIMKKNSFWKSKII